jgi:molybdate transport system ATP-binding protein
LFLELLLPNLQDRFTLNMVILLGLKLEKISKSWSDFNLKNITLNIENNDYLVILGPNGAGKTLLLETIIGFHKPDKGRIILNGIDITDEPPEKRNIGYVSQMSFLFPNMTVSQNVEFSLKMKGLPKTNRSQKVNQLLELMGLTSISNRRSTTLSGGEKQRVSLARAIATESQIIILDEPLTGIDLETASKIKHALKRLHLSGKTLIHVTHNQVEGFSLGSKMAIMNSGEIMQTGKPKEIFGKPQNTFVARFLGYENIFKAKLINQQGLLSIVNSNGVTLKVAGHIVNSECTIAVRPEDILVERSPIKNEKMNILKGTIIECIDQGPTVSIAVSAILPFNVVMTKNAFIEKELDIDTDIFLSINSETVKVID